MTTRVLTALDPGVEAQVATAVGGVREATIARRCVDLADLLASAEAGLGDVALVSAGLRGLGRDDVARLAASGARTIALVTGEEDEARVRQLGIAGVVRADASVADLEAALTAGGAEWAAELGLLDDAAGAGVPTPHGAPVVPQQPPAPEPVEGRITAVWGPTGAPGRTTIAVNLAAELAAAGASVILVDADTYGASIAQVLALLDEAPGVAAAARAGDLGTLDLPALSRLAPEVLPRLRVLTGIPRPDRWPEIRAASFEEVLRLSKLLAEHVVVDCGFCLEDDEELSYDTRAPRRNATTLITLESAEQVVVVGESAGLVDQAGDRVADRLETLVERLTAALVPPGVLHARVETERHRRVDRERRILADVVVGHGVAHLDRAVADHAHRRAGGGAQVHALLRGRQTP